ncbi:hypothetical protein [Lichenibacterium ramalinae]|uniref:Uncharacterized protein n=1 Tax=Lichenibacterium ramalinae TaxID=2316527 RepID=A0A4Q2RFU8_9HYPH|nr:hypothetical protein [Lichenibacterium ramalinae]RYB04462.1 hypothetical protein D3272_13585 [Lichenibacterium ramalinae]
MTTYIPNARPAAREAEATPRAPLAAVDTRVARIGAFSCQGLEELSRSLGFTVAVVAAVKDADAHLERLRALWYASGTPMEHEAWPLPFDFDNFFHRDWWRIPFDERWFGRDHHPLADCVEDGSLLVRLPTGITRGSFSASFRDGLSELRFEVVARHPSQCVRRRASGRPIDVRSRYSRASAGNPTPVEVRDLIAFSPRTLPRVADVAMGTLARLGRESDGGGDVGDR